LGSIWGIIFIFIGYKANPKLLEQFQFCEQENTQIPWLVMTADEEMAQQSVKLRCVATREETVSKHFWSIFDIIIYLYFSVGQIDGSCANFAREIGNVKE
jgi:hypothetical protein